ncbi:transposase family protein [Trichormus azollae]|uniref:transposase family protein n=1 Tax=Trichormus azollae TaxID=1164 RepID=UPI00325EE7BB
MGDLTVFIKNRRNLDAKRRFLGDKAYIGEELITTPYNKPKKAELSKIQKEENKEVSSRRIGVEHLICRVKTCRVATDRCRLARHRYNQVIMAVCGLVRLELSYSFILSHDI